MKHSFGIKKIYESSPVRGFVIKPFFELARQTSQLSTRMFLSHEISVDNRQGCHAKNNTHHPSLTSNEPCGD